MDPLLRELDKLLATMNEADRGRVIQGLRHIVLGGRELEGRINLSARALVQAFASFGIAIQQGRTFPEILARARARSKEIGSAVAGLFDAI